MDKLLRLIIISCLLITHSLICYSQSKPLRVVSLAPSLTDIVLELDGADLLVGVLDYEKIRPSVIAHVPSVGGFNQFSLEKLINVNPDIILVWPYSIKPADEQQLISLGYKIIEGNPHTLDELADQIAFIGQQIGREQQGQKLATEMHNKLTELRKKYHRETPINVFYQVWDKPIYTIGKNQIIGDALTTCGAKNIFDDIEVPAPIVSVETILARNPQAIIASQNNLLEAWQKWPTLEAVKHNRLLLFNNKNIARPNYAMLQATEQLCDLLSSH